jgi:perosamine synthetase
MIAHSKPTLGKEEIRVMTRVVNSGQLAQGVRVRRFEEECAELVGRKHAVAVSSGTAALHLALGAVGVAPEEPVAVPSYACAALITAVTLQQGRPLLCDIRGRARMGPGADRAAPVRRDRHVAARRYRDRRHRAIDGRPVRAVVAHCNHIVLRD